MKIGKIFASAGCGKTTRLLAITEQLFNQGIKPHEVMFTTFTRSGAYEAQERAMLKFGFKETQFPYFRTLHSICYRQCSSPTVMNFRDYIHLGKALSVRFGGTVQNAEPADLGKGDAYLSLYNLQKNLGLERISPYEYGCNFSYQEYEHFVKTYEQYKSAHGKYDYTDLIEETAESGDPLPIQYAIIDEAQDLTPLQWKAIQRLSQNVRWLWLAGDDDQSIYTYSGADPNILIDLRADRVEHLEISYRLPPMLSAFANEIAARISKREHKTIRPRQAEKQCLEFISSFESVKIDPEKDTVVLIRNRFLSSYVAEALLSKGIMYINNCDQMDTLGVQVQAAELWTRLYEGGECYGSELEPYAKWIPTVFWRKNQRTVLKESDKKITMESLVKEHKLLKTGPWHEVLDLPRKEFLMKKWDGRKPNVQINTIHTFKGREVDHAIVMTDVSHQTYKAIQNNPDSEHRVFFVAFTRSREKLTIVRPLTDKHYPI